MPGVPYTTEVFTRSNYANVRSRSKSAVERGNTAMVDCPGDSVILSGIVDTSREGVQAFKCLVMEPAVAKDQGIFVPIGQIPQNQVEEFLGE